MTHTPRQTELNSLTHALTGINTVSLHSILSEINALMDLLQYSSQPEIKQIQEDLLQMRFELSGRKPNCIVVRRILLRLHHNTSLMIADPQRGTITALYRLLNFTTRCIRALREPVSP